MNYNSNNNTDTNNDDNDDDDDIHDGDANDYGGFSTMRRCRSLIPHKKRNRRHQEARRTEIYEKKKSSPRTYFSVILFKHVNHEKILENMYTGMHAHYHASNSNAQTKIYNIIDEEHRKAKNVE